MPSPYTGVSYHIRSKKWNARLTTAVNGIIKRVDLGSAFSDSTSAAKARDK